MTELTKQEQIQVANTILDQLGGKGKLTAMIGAYNFVALDGLGGVQFQFRGIRKANRVVIAVLPSDTYMMEIGKLAPRTYDWKTIYSEKGLYADILKPEFEETTGLYLSL